MQMQTVFLSSWRGEEVKEMFMPSPTAPWAEATVKFPLEENPTSTLLSSIDHHGQTDILVNAMQLVQIDWSAVNINDQVCAFLP